MKIKEIKVKSIIVKSNLPEGDFVINPYIGCQHGCKYCYARFMKRFTGHTEPWGFFVDVKINASDLIPEDTNKYKDKSIVISSVTDPYQPIERKYKLTRKILERLIPLQPHLSLMTKSDLVIRDVDLFKQFKDCLVAFSLSVLDDKTRKEIEPLSSSVDKRINALKNLHKANIPTALFISPIFPEITDWKKIINKTKSFVGEYWFENLNLYSSIKNGIYRFLRENKPELVEKYKKIYSKDSNYWNIEENNINEFCKKNKLNCRIYFHHKTNHVQQPLKN
ncbi:radical SAM protein [Patescibacteria group bacterium]|nr:radical SAM protein [Patescibacteria group bacterium]MBU4056313.1 radical SAM protein [Patescibacteria group bacterium]MBU4368284.1 radical SAM protein [Patescibacteria group bacterium]